MEGIAVVARPRRGIVIVVLTTRKVDGVYEVSFLRPRIQLALSSTFACKTELLSA